MDANATWNVTANVNNQTLLDGVLECIAQLENIIATSSLKEQASLEPNRTVSANQCGHHSMQEVVAGFDIDSTSPSWQALEQQDESSTSRSAEAEANIHALSVAKNRRASRKGTNTPARHRNRDRGEWIVAYVVARNALNGEAFTLHDVHRLYCRTRAKSSRALPPQDLANRFKQETTAYRWFQNLEQPPPEAEINRQRIAKRRYKLLRDLASASGTQRQTKEAHAFTRIRDLAVQDKGQELRLPTPAN